ncbi:VCBS repeat-containing protein [Negadavirga shengliensis]|uniref:VCBS repeat-containing protein n=1 Tax=Negadavirga shengliensis TaxID=1389218 RepID=A0ABV9T4W1_9BACT
MKNRIFGGLILGALILTVGDRSVLAQGFEQISPKKSGIKFQNNLKESRSANILTYEYFYNGGGVAIGDINNDGLDDIYFTGNMVANRLYLNQGDFKFKDITKQAGVEGRDAWTTGVTMVDINGDGFLDIYVCYSGKGDPDQRRNQLFINQGDGTFKDEAAAYGLDDPSNSIHALFFDYDRDGDLDMYLLNHNTNVINEIEFDAKRRDRNKYAGDKLFRNDGGKFTDVSEKTGIKGNSMGFGLGVAVSDLNGDGYPDIYISNDYIEPDYLYINNGDGTFSEQLTDYLQHISYFSMGSDISDINNDGLPDIYTLDMLPEDNNRQKLLYGPENYEQYALMVMKGFYHQNMRNMLHLNLGNGLFSEIGQLAGVSNTDWSWAAFFADFDNDGWKDLFVTNGYYRDYTNRDFLKYKGDYYFSKARAKETADTLHLVTSMTSTPVHNYIFKNQGGINFENKTTEWGFSEPGFSNGAAFADLDNDGSIDLVVNHLNGNAGIYRNKLVPDGAAANFLQVELKGGGLNTFGVGAKIYAYSGGDMQFFEQQPSRGFQSSVSPRIHIGLGNKPHVDSLKVIWPGGDRQVLQHIQANTRITVKEEDALPSPGENEEIPEPLFTQIVSPIGYEHEEPGYNDFKRQPLLYHMLSPSGPAMAVGDVNKNGFPDLYVGGTQGKPGKLYFQVSTGQFLESQGLDLSQDELSADTDALFFDANGDGWQDLYIVSGGYHDYEKGDDALQDRLYMNRGGGNFIKADDALPEIKTSGSCVRVADFDGDGHLDLFIGGRVVPGEYPSKPSSYLLQNDGTGKFKDVTAAYLAEIEGSGMVTDAQWLDINGDGWQDLVVVGEFMPIQVLLNKEGKGFENATHQYFDRPMSGMWSRIAVGDFDNDGDLDFIIGNFGLNSQFKASDDEPITMMFADFDNNGSVDPILCQYILGVSYPFLSRDELLDQMYGMRSKFTDYAAFADAKLEDILTKEQIESATTLEVNELRTLYLENRGNRLIPHELPMEAQFAPIYAIAVIDHNDDGNLDFILAGNQNTTRLRLGVIDANFGQLYEGDGNGNFKYVEQKITGLNFIGDVKSLQPIKLSYLEVLLVGINNLGIEAYLLNRSMGKNNLRKLTKQHQ